VPLIVVLLLPSVAFLFLVLLSMVVLTGARRAFPRVGGGLERLWSRRFPGGGEWFRASYFIAMNSLLFLPVGLYSILSRATVFRRFQDDLSSFLVTRQLLCGSGGLNLRSGGFEIAQRPSLTTSVGEIVMFGRHKTIFDLKGLLYDPLALFRPEKKLTVTLGDSNLADLPCYLKFGATALVIEMIEAGVDLSDLRLRRPVRAFREIARGGPFKELDVRSRAGGGPGRMTAIDVQREYLRRAREHFQGRPDGRVRYREVLDLWEEALGLLADHPARLADRLDWAAKKSLLDRAILPAGAWRRFSAWSRILSRAPAGLPGECRSLEELLERCPPLLRLRLRVRTRRAIRCGDIDPARFEEARDLFYAAQKIDLRYHELGADPGYQRQLESEGLIRRLTTEAEVERAAAEAPRDTRARIRGYYIGLGQTPESIRANWGEVEIAGISRSIAIPDPFQHRLPTD
jgi:Pup-ligase protein